ncbi:hypothetical protein GGS24DRAFT_509015 [Hypoxylon argillaceum]|nr:hypothetical protein GGS24DRAFT_509015 [Hypoxylon argillaceum]
MSRNIEPNDIRPDSRNLLAWNDIDLTPIGNPIMVLAMMAYSPTDSNGANLGFRLDALPNELLLGVALEMPPGDRIRAAFAFPSLLMNDNRVNIYTVDTIDQLRIPTYIPVGREVELEQQPLIIRAIYDGTYSVAQIGIILDQYEAACVYREVDRHVFLNSSFPDNSPNNHVAANPPVVRNVATPLHAAVVARRLDIIKYLLSRGADPQRTIQNEPPPQPFFATLTPYQLAIDLVFADAHSPDRNIERHSQFEEIALHLAYTSDNGAYTPDFHNVSTEMRLACSSGMERLALLLLNRSGRPRDAIRLSLEFILQQNVLFTHAITSPHPIPQVITQLYQRGATFVDFVLERSATEVAISEGHVMNAAAALRFEIENIGKSWSPMPLVNRSIVSIASLALNDENLFKTKLLVLELLALNYRIGLQRVYWYAIAGRRNSDETREWLLQFAVGINGWTLRTAIAYKDRQTVTYILQSFLDTGRSVDELPELLEEDGEEGNSRCWHSTPLNLALSANNYYEAAHLLSLGANPDLVQPNIRHRVRVVRERCQTGEIDPLTFVFGSESVSLDGHMNIPAEAHAILHYVFTRMLDDLEHPVPPYIRPRRHSHIPNDHPDNDSEAENGLGIFDVHTTDQEEDIEELQPEYYGHYS